MAFPAVVGTPTESNATADDTEPWTVSRPAGVNGQLTIVLFTCDGEPSLSWPSGYTSLGSTSGGGFTFGAAYRLEDGTEGTTFNISSTVGGFSEKWAAIVYSISGAESPATQAPELTLATGTASNPNPPANTPTGGAKDYLWIAAGAMDGEEADDDTWANTPPTGYTPSPPRQKTSDIAGGPTSNVSLCSAEQQLNAASENPATFSLDVGKDWVAFLIAIHPPAGPAGPPTAGYYSHHYYRMIAGSAAS